MNIAVEAVGRINIAAVVTAAGSGTRLGADKPKALVELAGEPLLVWAVRGMRAAGVHQIVVTAPADSEATRAEFTRTLAAAGFSQHDGVVVTPGGGTRQESVALGLAAVADHFPDATHVLIHDAARALTPPEMIERVANALAAGFDAVIPVLPVVDTIKEVAAAGDSGAEDLAGAQPSVFAYTETVARTVCRASLRAVQTPQGFELGLIARAHQAGSALSVSEQAAAPDDAALVELLGEPVATVPGDRRALKITTAFDLRLAQWLAGEAEPTRINSHKFE